MKPRIKTDANNLFGYAVSKFLPTRGYKRKDRKDFDPNKYSSNSSTGIEAETNNDKDGKALYKVMSNAVYGKTMQDL